MTEFADVSAIAARHALGLVVVFADLATDDAIFRREVARDGRVLFADPPSRWIDFVGQTLIDYTDIARSSPPG